MALIYSEIAKPASLQARARKLVNGIPSPKTPRRRRLRGLAHSVLRSAIWNAVASTEPDYRITEDIAGDELIDILGVLNGRGWRVFLTTASMLARNPYARRP
jgi:hypothetical protein